MAVISHVQAGSVASSAHQNGLIDQVNSNTRVAETVGTGVFTTTDTVSSWATQVQAALGRPQAGAFFGQWTDNNGGAGVNVDNASGGGGDGVKMTDIGTAIGTPVGCSLSNGTFTANNAGLWMLNLSLQTIGGADNIGIRAIYFALGNAANTPAGTKYGLIAAGQDSTALSTSTVVRLNAGQQVSSYMAIWTAGGKTTIWRARGNLLTATWIGQ
ncbi:hypothetical protein LZ318_11970 [Saccharopolyspora indica]|uniref:hypothetical protein n=1 Tax=Saccharopolyspora indica TaxID=1229659 RepID=UPI0022EB6F98|nr:hypothetical protein [Saccharopolyspora indica]MDA3643775.1 hypothetical protein [Saccharopolyspora indica]